MTTRHKPTAPRLRFKGFDGEWEEKILGDFVKSLDAGVSVNSEDKLPEIDDFSILKTSCLSYGAFDENERKRVVLQSEISRLKEELKSNSILMSRMNTPNLVGLSAYIEKAPKKTFLPDRLWQLKTDSEQVNTEWLACYLGKPENLLKIQDKATGTSGSMKNITKNDVFLFEILAPKLPEQTQLGNFFRELDHRIAQSRTLWEKSRQLKQAMLAKMFPAASETTPKIRFKGFSGEWERKTLGDLGYCVSGVGFPESEQGGENGIPFFKVSDMNLVGNEVFLKKANHYVTQEQINKYKWRPINQLPCIFFAKVGAALLLNRKRLVNNPFLLDNNTMVFIINNGLNDYFIKTLFDTIDLPELAQVGALPSINAKDVESVPLMLPEKAEQTAIGNFFRQLDDTIALQTAETEQLGRLKKALLAAMLV